MRDRSIYICLVRRIVINRHIHLPICRPVLFQSLGVARYAYVFQQHHTTYILREYIRLLTIRRTKDSFFTSFYIALMTWEGKDGTGVPS